MFFFSSFFFILFDLCYIYSACIIIINVSIQCVQLVYCSPKCHFRLSHMKFTLFTLQFQRSISLFQQSITSKMLNKFYTNFQFCCCCCWKHVLRAVSKFLALHFLYQIDAWNHLWTVLFLNLVSTIFAFRHNIDTIYVNVRSGEWIIFHCLQSKDPWDNFLVLFLFCFDHFHLNWLNHPICNVLREHWLANVRINSQCTLCYHETI